jgi:hypothetical protein
MKKNKNSLLYAKLYRNIDFRKNPELYHIGRGEQGVLIAEPYKSELLPLWRFKTPAVARKSAQLIYEKYLFYKAQGDFVGMDMARKFLQMGFTRSRRYANHKTGIKWNESKTAILPNNIDLQKARSARYFKEKCQLILADPDYKALRAQHQKKLAE